MVAQIIVKTQRHTFGKELYTALNQFAQEHKNDDRKTYKALWQKWTESDNIKEWIVAEMAKQPGKDVLDKMYKSSWYYYRKRGDEKEEIVDKIPRKQYDAFDQQILKTIDEHIRNQIKTTMVINEKSELISNISPAESFEKFCEDERELLLEEIRASYGEDEDSPVTTDEANQVVEKFKKAYKNKFYKIRVELMNQV
jgi:hypothetical protein